MLVGMSVFSCNSDEDDSQVWSYTSVAVEGFSLTADEKVLVNLDSVFFSIDLNAGRIYNADSLPLGTDITKLVPKISTSNVGAVELTVHRGAPLGDTTYNYLADQHDSIDFSHGPVTLRIKSQDLTYTRDYEVKVNVHNMKPDSLYWNRNARRSLPTVLEAPVAQKTVEIGGKALCLTVDASGAACVALADNPSQEWEMTSVTLPSGAVAGSLTTVADNALFITTTDGSVYVSADNGSSWEPTGAVMHSLFGAYEGNLVGARREASGSWKITSYPVVREFDAPAGFPVEGASTLISYTTKWSNATIAVMSGGIQADGTLTGASWAFDGTAWARLSTSGLTSLPAGDGYAVVPYFAFKTSSSWRVSRETCLLAFGGRTADGVSSKVYISWDRGISWKQGDELLQMPDYIPPFAGADAMVFDTTLGSTASDAWKSTASRELPVWWTVTPPGRADEAPQTWECPYIYIFGGLDNNGDLSDNVWRGVINRLSFKPLY